MRTSLLHRVAIRGLASTSAGHRGLAGTTENRRSAGWLPAVLICAPVGVWVHDIGDT